MALAAICFAGFILMILAQVSYRYLGISMVFSEDAARLLNIYAVFLGLVMVVHKDGDVRIDLIDRFLARNLKLQTILRIGYAFILIALLSAITFGSYLLMKANWGFSLPAIPFLHQGHIYLAPFIGSILSIVVTISKLHGYFTHGYEPVEDLS